MCVAMRLSVLLLSLLFLVCGGLRAQETKRLSRQAIDSLMNIKPIRGGERILSFSSTCHDFGVIYESDKPKEITFGFVNKSSEPLTITKVTTNCGCTASSFTKGDIQPGDSGIVKVIYNPHRRSGTVDTNAFVYTSLTGDRPVAKLTLLGNVIDNNEWAHLPLSMGCMRVKRKAVQFEQVKNGTAPEQRIPCANVGEKPVRLTAVMLPGFVELFTEPAEIAPGEEGDIVIRIIGDKLPSSVPGKFNIVVDGIGGRVSERTIKVTIEK